MAKKLQLVITCILSFIISLFQLRVKTRENPAFTRRLRNICHSQTPNPINGEGLISIQRYSQLLRVGTKSGGSGGTSGSTLPSRLLFSSSLPLLLSKQMTSWARTRGGSWGPSLALKTISSREEKMEGNVKTTLSSDVASERLNSLLLLLPSKELPPEERRRGVSQIFQSPFKLPLSLLVLIS